MLLWLGCDTVREAALVRPFSICYAGGNGVARYRPRSGDELTPHQTQLLMGFLGEGSPVRMHAAAVDALDDCPAIEIINFLLAQAVEWKDWIKFNRISAIARIELPNPQLLALASASPAARADVLYDLATLVRTQGRKDFHMTQTLPPKQP